MSVCHSVKHPNPFFFLTTVRSSSEAVALEYFTKSRRDMSQAHISLCWTFLYWTITWRSPLSSTREKVTLT